MKKFDYRGLTGEVVTKDSFNYEEDRKAWNRGIEKYPLVIVYCRNEYDINNAITWAKLNLLEIRIRSGRHHYEGYSTGNDIVIIDVSKMNKIDVDEEKSVFKIQGGVRNRELYEVLGSKHYPFPGGGCPTVGVAGLVLGGGWSYSNRLFGLACDNLLEIEMVNYEGKKIIASEKNNEDLFWACRGAGGGNFGVITSMTFKLIPKIEMVTLIDIDFADIEFQEILKIFEIWTKFFNGLDRRINLKMGMHNSKIKGKGVRITGLFYGNKEEANRILEPFNNISEKVKFKLEYLKILEANRKIQDSHPPYEKFKSSGRFVYNDYTKRDMKEIIKIIEHRQEGSIYSAISLYGLGGAVKDRKDNDTAFNYRDAKFIMGYQSVWEDSKYAQINKEWVIEKLNFIKDYTLGSYINFPLAELDDYEREYYGENIEKLRKIKSKYDPYNIFKFPQGIKIC